MAEGMEWVEIIEPRTKKHMYANLITGECVWDQPVGQRVKKTDHNQWWELYDSNTARFYYYNATSQMTVWSRPENSDIIPLAKLQTLKQNTEVRDEENGKSRKRDSASTQTSSPNGTSFIRAMATSSVKKNGQFERANPGSVRKFSSETQTTPQSSPKDVKRHPSHHHHVHKCTSRGNGSQTTVPETSFRASLPMHRQASNTSQQRIPTSRGQEDIFDEGGGEMWNGGLDRLASQNSSRGLMVSSESGRTPSPRSPAMLSHHDVPMGSLQRAGHRLYENSAIAESENGLFNMEASPSTSFGRNNNPMVAPLPRRQRSFDYKNGFVDGGEPFRPNGRKENFQNSSMPCGIRSVESTPRVQRRNNADVLLPQISEINMAIGSQIRQHQDAFAISGGTPMQSRKKRSLPKTNGNLSASPQHSRLPTPSTPSGVSQPNEIGSNSSHSHSSLESRRSLFGSKQAAQSQSVQSSFPLFAAPFSPPNNRQDWSPHASQRLQPQEPSMSSFNPMFGKSSQLRRTISVDRHDLKSPSSDGSSKPPTPFSPQLLRRNTTKPPRISPNDLEEDRKAEELLKATKDAAKEYEIITSFSSHRPVNGNRSFDRALESRKPVPPIPVLHSDSDTDSQDNDADVEDSDECDEDEDDEDVDEIMALDHSGQTRYGHLSPSQLRMHPNYCAIDRGIKSLNFDGFSAPHNESSDEEEGESPYRSERDKVHNLVDTRHASLRRKINQPLSGSKLMGLEKSQSVQTELALSAQHQPRPQSIIFPTQSEQSLTSTKSSSPVCRPYYPGLNHGSSTLTRDRSFVSAERELENPVKLENHTKGIFRKKVSIASLLSWSKDSINKPLIMTSDKSVKKEACTMFRLVQMYMSDRKAKENKSQDEIALDLTRTAWQKASLRDELFIQICKQTTENRKPESLRRGWELMAICLAFFPPSANFFAYLHSYISRFQSPVCDSFEVQVSHYASHSLKRLERMSQTGAKRGIRKPTVEEIQQARVQIFHPSMFGNSLDDVMQLQKERFPDRRLPWIQTILSEEIQRLHGIRTEGIFRVPGDIDEVNMLKVRMDRWNSPDCCDPHVPSSLLKLWYRELYEPLIPARFYDLCIQNCNNPAGAVEIVGKLPAINRLVLTYLINFLQEFAQPENVLLTKMDTANLAMVMAPNCLRCMSDDPQVIFENTRKEMSFIRTLMQSLETTWIEGMR